MRLRGNIQKQAFTRRDLLAAIIMSGVLVTCFVPANAKNKSSSAAVACLRNVQGWAEAWTLHALDNNGLYATGIQNQSSTAPRVLWVRGFLNFNPDGLNYDPNQSVALSPLNPYYADYEHKVWRCPADKSAVRSSVTNRALRVRSYSMSHAFDAGSWLPSPQYRTYSRMSDVVNPTRTWAFMDEHPDSINDGVLAVQMYEGQGRIIDYPASHHGGASALVYVDGSGEVHRWESPLMRPRIKYNGNLALNVPAPGAAADLIWLSERTTVLR
jgi:hypothetical protein